MKRIFLISFLICIVFLLGLFVFRLQVTTLLFSKGLALAGFDNVQIEITAISPTKIKLSHLRLTKKESGLTLELKNTILFWSKTSLTNKQLESIDIDFITINLPRRDTSSTQKDFHIAELAGNLQNLKQQLPFQALTIHHMVVIGESIGLLAGKPVSLTVKKNKKDKKIVADLYLQEPAVHISIEHYESQKWNFRINESEKTTPSSPLLTAIISLHKSELQLEAEIELARLSLFNPLLDTPLPSMAGTVSLKAIQPFLPDNEFSLQIDMKNLQLADFHAESINLAAQGEMISPALFLLGENSYLSTGKIKNNDISINEINLNMEGGTAKFDGSWQYRLSEKNKLTVTGLSAPPLKITSLSVSSAITLGFSPEKKQVSVGLFPDFRILSTGIMANDLSMGEIIISPEKESIFSVTLPKKIWSLTPSLWQISVDDLQTENNDFSITSAPLILISKTVAGTGSEYQITGRLSSNNVHLKSRENGFEMNGLDTRFKITNIHQDSGLPRDIKITSNFSFVPAAVPGKITGKLFHNLKTGKGKINLNTKEPLLFSQTNPLTSLVDKWPWADIELDGGKIDSKAVIKWQPDEPAHALVELSLEQGKGIVQGVSFSGFSTNQTLHVIPAIRSQKPGTIHIDRINSAVEVKNLQTTLNLSPSPHDKLPVVYINNLSLEILGGTVSGENIVVDPRQPDVSTELIIYDIDLARLAKIQQVQGLNIAGRIHGILPIRFDSSGLHINDGFFSNRQTKGIIRYTPDGTRGLKDPPLTRYAILALEEFHYHLLTAHAEYSPDGTLLVKLRLEGTSPKIETSRPVHLNINTEQNILSLLESLRYSKQTTREIKEKLQKHYQRSGYRE